LKKRILRLEEVVSLLLNEVMNKLSLMVIFLSLPSFACVTGEIHTTPAGLNYVCDELSPGIEGWRDPRGLIWGKGQNCEEISARNPAADELRNFEAEMGLTASGSYCVKYVIHHYNKFPQTPATPYTEDTLDFYREEDLYGEFSNFSGFPVFVDGEWWSTSEHYYQAQKFLSEELRDWVQFAPTPMEAANRGRNPDYPMRDDWDDVKDSYMEKALFDKYTRHEVLTELLRSTGDSHIFEHTTNDCYWADCGDRSGKNHLGLLLMKVRESLR
jgi:ribA/ribD-fused uncharacterized protein